MRDIIFRGKRVDNGQWVYGFLIVNKDGTCYIKDTDYNVNNGRIDLIPEKVIPESVGEYTGITDSQDKKIFEGDILKFEGTISQYEVRFENGSFVCYHHTNKEFGRWGNLSRIKDHDFSKYQINVIGNIHDTLTPQQA